MRVPVTVALIIALFALVPAQGSRDASQPVFRDIEGRTLRLSDYRGSVLLINFWATWCAPCRAEMPDLVRWQRQYKSRGLRVIGIAMPPADLPEVRRVIRKLKVNYPIVIGDAETRAQFDKGDTLPVTVVIDREGAVREIIQGVIFPEEFTQKIEPLLRQDA